MAGSRPSRTGQDMERNAQAVAESAPVAWSKVRELYPEQIAQRVDDLINRGGVTLRDLSALTMAQLLKNLEDQQDGMDVKAEIAGQVRMLYRIALVSGGVGDAATVMVQVPEGLKVLPEPDGGDELI